MRMHASEYVRAKAAAAAIQPLVRPVAWRADQSRRTPAAVIFTRADSGIRRVSDLKGKSFLFGTADSTLTLGAKASLVEAGIRASHLSRFRYLDRTEDVSRSGVFHSLATSLSELGNPFSEMTAVEAVLDGIYDAAVATEGRFVQVSATEKLVLLKRFDDEGYVIAAKTSLAPDAAISFGRAMVELKDQPPVGSLSPELNGFEPCTEGDFGQLRQKLVLESLFDENGSTNQLSLWEHRPASP